MAPTSLAGHHHTPSLGATQRHSTPAHLRGAIPPTAEGLRGGQRSPLPQKQLPTTCTKAHFPRRGGPHTMRVLPPPPPPGKDAGVQRQAPRRARQSHYTRPTCTQTDSTRRGVKGENPPKKCRPSPQPFPRMSGKRPTRNGVHNARRRQHRRPGRPLSPARQDVPTPQRRCAQTSDVCCGERR
ncbi:uncharacterized protein Tco025E_05281 [Trypanosoma conorhini]|uniref:Uncharacterized protein n=1 Tax=Trypanosoma conorhini TaxID=83891 RepID=A0A422PEM8_9TRYP|nr:uncharacterized protein Tco025E_05281 [Trypanosoma conorhini]RNF16169.1 hypothetical protein Tco025E_05281 [Trypanosoma conorhini]